MKHLFLLLIFLWCSAVVVRGQNPEMFLCPFGENLVRCTLANNTENGLLVRSAWMMQPGNAIFAVQLNSDTPVWTFTGYSVDANSPEFSIAPDCIMTNTLDLATGGCCLSSDEMICIRWQIDVPSRLFSNKAYLSVDCETEPSVVCPTEGLEISLLNLALHRFSQQPDNTDVGFLVLNGSNAAVTVAQPLFNDSRLIVHAPKIGYSNEVFSVDAAATNATVAARGTTEWRVPWTNLWNRLPAADRTSLTTAHEVDLYWRSGDFTSEALPLWIE